MAEAYHFDDESYDALARAGLNWQEVLHALRHQPRVRHHIGSVLRVAGRTPRGQWIGVALIEETDDEYLVVAAHALDENEIAAVKVMLQGGQT